MRTLIVAAATLILSGCVVAPQGGAYRHGYYGGAYAPRYAAAPRYSPAPYAYGGGYGRGYGNAYGRGW